MPISKIHAIIPDSRSRDGNENGQYVPFQSRRRNDSYIGQLVTRAGRRSSTTNPNAYFTNSRWNRQRYGPRHRPVWWQLGSLPLFTRRACRKSSRNGTLASSCFLRRLSDVSYDVEDYDPKLRRRKTRDIVMYCGWNLTTIPTLT